MGVTAHLPLGALQLVGQLVGTLAGALPTRSRARCLVNLRLAYPELSERERRRLARRSMASMGSMAMELPALFRGRPDRITRLVRSVEGREHLEAAIARGRGVILAMPHIGSWELVGLYCSTLAPFTALYRPNRVDQMDEVFRKGRSRLGGRLVPAGFGAVRTLRRTLQRGELIAILPDTDPKQGNTVFAPLFGEPANTSTLVSRLASGSRATVLMTFAERLGPGRGFRMHFRPTSPEVAARDPVIAATALNREVEATIRLAPQQYLWRYRRFRRRPAGHAPLYDRPPGATAPPR